MPPGRVAAAREAAEGGAMEVAAAERAAAAAVALGGGVEVVRVRDVVSRRRVVVRECIVGCWLFWRDIDGVRVWRGWFSMGFWGL